jgi:hypothetical protein
MRGERVLRLTFVCAALAACDATEPRPDGAQGTGSNKQADAGQPAIDPAPDPTPDDAGEVADPNCEQARGIFEPLYTRLSGECGNLDDANNVRLEGDIQIEKFANVDVETETVIDGCSVSLVQIVRDKVGVPQKRIAGTLQIDSPTRLAGQVTLTRHDTNGVPVCFGTYDAVLAKNTVVGGGGL